MPTPPLGLSWGLKSDDEGNVHLFYVSWSLGQHKNHLRVGTLIKGDSEQYFDKNGNVHSRVPLTFEFEHDGKSWQADWKTVADAIMNMDRATRKALDQACPSIRATILFDFLTTPVAASGGTIAKLAGRFDAAWSIAAGATGGNPERINAGPAATFLGLDTRDPTYNASEKWIAPGSDVGEGVFGVCMAWAIGKQVEQPEPLRPLHRSYVRVGTRQSVESLARRTATGQFRDANTGDPIIGKYDLGHQKGSEFWRLQFLFEKLGISQEGFNNLMNNPRLYQIEDPILNRGHQFELKE